MSLISVTMQFASREELLAFFGSNPVPAAQPIVASLPGEGVKQGNKSAKSSAAASTLSAGGAAPATGQQAAAGAPTDPKAGAAEHSAQGGQDASNASSPVPYATLQKAVFALANKNRDAVMAVAKSLGVENFKGFEKEENAGGRAAALEAVNAKLAELEVA